MPDPEGVCIWNNISDHSELQVSNDKKNNFWFFCENLSEKVCELFSAEFLNMNHKKEDTGACAPVHLHLYPLPIMSDMPYMLFPGRYELRHTNPDNPGSIRIESE